jgi:CO/xanthine dehydrogenase FAD-binding subunit
VCGQAEEKPCICGQTTSVKRSVRSPARPGPYWREVRISIPHAPLSLCATMCWTFLASQSYAASLKGIAPGASGRSRPGTVAGNLCNASPAADGVPVLMALGAEVGLSSADTARRLPLKKFVTGNRTTARQPNELVTAVLIPKWGSTAKSTFLKLGARKYLVISIASVAVAVATDGQNIVTDVGIAVGSCAPVASRLTGLECKLTGTKCTKGLADLVSPQDLSMLAPISDIRGTV